MEAKEKKAQRYVQEKMFPRIFNAVRQEEPLFTKEYLKKAYIKGWDESLKSLWISVEERMPKPNTDVIFITDIGMIMNGQYDGNVWMQMDGVWGSAYSSINKCWNVIAWMPIPSFNEILETNKDVLKRLKYK